uniref:Uncharacterized protein n=1 Tax=Anopheles albimanus TaxID=7167 RepID=A0A182FXL3_ANOAL
MTKNREFQEKYDSDGPITFEEGVGLEADTETMLE